jgi:ribosomal protein S18 acetylase RimI-like enzyme
MTTLSIRNLEDHDFPPVWDIFTTAFPMKYGIEFQDAWRLRDTKHSYGCFINDCLTGFMLVRWKDGDDWHIEFLGVSPTCQKGGIGTTLLHALLNFCQKTQSRATLIPVDDPRIIHWYKKQGFVECGAPRKSSYTGDLEQVMEFRTQREILI